MTRLPEDLLLENKSDMDRLLESWEAFVEGLEKENVRLQHSTGAAASRWGLGYATPDGKVKYIINDRNGKWVWKEESR